MSIVIGLALALLLAAVAALGPAAPAHAVAHGVAAEPGAFPFNATLVGRGRSAVRHQRCGGSLVAPDRVLTAAHCVVGTAPGDVRVLVGRHRLSGAGGALRSIKGFYAAAAYRLLDSPFGGDFASSYDIAVVVLERPVLGVAPVPLADSAELAPETPIVTLGHGRTAGVPPRNEGPVGDVLQLARQTIRPAAECATAYRSLFRPTEHLCTFDRAGRPNASACRGDSGGPLLVQRPDGAWAQAGIVTWGGEVRSAPCSPQPWPDVSQRTPGLAAYVARSRPVLAPQPVRRPFVRRRSGRLTCLRGEWRGSGVRYEYRWMQREVRVGRPGADGARPITNDDATIRGATRSTLSARGRHGMVVCEVTAKNAGGVVVVRSMNVVYLRP